MGDGWWEMAWESTIEALGRDFAAEARIAHDLDETRARIERSRSFLRSLQRVRDGQGQQEQAGLVLVADSGAADRRLILEVMHSSTRLNAWRASQVGERLGRTDTGDIRRLMEQMVTDGELVRSSDRRYRLSPAMAAAPKGTPHRAQAVLVQAGRSS